MKLVLAKAAADMLRSGASAEDAAQACVRLLAKRTNGAGGLILLDRQGQMGFAFNTSRMAYGYVAADGSFVVAA